MEIDERLKAWGLDAHIYARHIEPRMRAIGRPDSEYEACLNEAEDLLIWHYSIHAPNLELYKRSQNRKMVVYHNITPAKFFRGYSRELEVACRLGRWELSELRGCELALGVSEYNRRELVAVGFDAERTGVLPLFLGEDAFAEIPRNEQLYRSLKEGDVANLLFVGRVAPNKAFADLIKIFFHYHRYRNPNSRLVLVGVRSLPLYDRELDRLVERLGLAGSVRFAGRIPLADLKATYEAADVFVCASRHEGFCIPLLEAMHFEVPILARAETGVPFTLKDAGVQFHSLQYAVLAETVHLLVQDKDMRQQIVATQKRRLADFAPAKVQDMLRDTLCQLGLEIQALPGGQACASTR
jgi:glycosyltransferase involved in cell wall biosynthesis